MVCVATAGVRSAVCKSLICVLICVERRDFCLSEPNGGDVDLIRPAISIGCFRDADWRALIFV